MKQKLLIATRSKGKLSELQKLLGPEDFQCVTLDDTEIPFDFDVEETALTFEGNALIKAFMYGKKTGLITLAEDSGLEIDALERRPGVFSKRFFPGTDMDRCKKILDELKNVPDENLQAEFHTAVALYDPKREKIATCQGVYRGVIVREPKGANGFGYDPIFYNQILKKTNAEMSSEEKNSVSHRGKALRSAKEILKKEFFK